MERAVSEPASEPRTGLNRRRLLNWFLGTSFGALAVAVIFPILRFITPPEVPEASANEVEAGAVNDPSILEKGFKIIRFGAEPVIVVKAAENEFRAFSATCTHLDCIVGFQKDERRLWCNCHGGSYDLNGKNVGGPPPKPLTPYKVNVVEKAPGSSLIVVSKA